MDVLANPGSQKGKVADQEAANMPPVTVMLCPEQRTECFQAETSVAESTPACCPPLARREVSFYYWFHIGEAQVLGGLWEAPGLSSCIKYLNEARYSDNCSFWGSEPTLLHLPQGIPRTDAHGDGSLGCSHQQAEI